MNKTISYTVKTYGVTAEKLNEIYSDFMKKNKDIKINFKEYFDECDVIIEYNIENTKVKDLQDIEKKVDAYMYGKNDDKLETIVFNKLIATNSKLAVAESYTGGSVSKSLIMQPGASAFFCEGIISYSIESKIRRLQVDKDYVEKEGAVNEEIIYQMAIGLLETIPECNLVLATSGNAGPTAQKNKVGQTYLAVGNRNGIHIYSNLYKDNRENVIFRGTRHALFHLFKFLNNIKKKI